jgi:hypothetical protein
MDCGSRAERPEPFTCLAALLFYTGMGPVSGKALDMWPWFSYESMGLKNSAPEDLMKKLALILLALILLATVAIGAFAADTTVKGYLVDRACAATDGNEAGFGAKHTKECLQMPDCEKSGYAVLTEDKKVIVFDKNGNAQAKKFIAALTKKKDVRVTVTGTVNGDQITVSKIELQ